MDLEHRFFCELKVVATMNKILKQAPQAWGDIQSKCGWKVDVDFMEFTFYPMKKFNGGHVKKNRFKCWQIAHIKKPLLNFQENDH